MCVIYSNSVDGLQSDVVAPLLVLAGPDVFRVEPVTLTAVTRLAEIIDTSPVNSAGGGVAPGDGTAGLRASIVIVAREALEGVASYELDVAVRVVAESGAAGLVLVGLDRVPTTVARLAQRSGIRIFGCPADMSIVLLVRLLDEMLEAGHYPSIERAQRSVAELHRADPELGPAELVQLAGGHLKADLDVRWFDDRRADRAARVPREPVVVNGVVVGTIGCAASASPPDSADDAAISLVLPTLCAAVSRRVDTVLAGLAAGADAAAAVIHAVGESRAQTDQRAREAGLPVDCSHAVVCVVGSTDGVGGSSVARQRYQTLGAVTVEFVLPARAEHGARITTTWIEDGVGLVLSDSGDPGAVKQAAAVLLAELARQFPQQRFYGGIGSVGVGADGLRSTAAEALAAARRGRRQAAAGQVTALAQSGLSRIIGELSTATMTRRCLEQALAPLDALSTRSRYTLIKTLSTYLDCQGSRTKAAAALYLHPNAVKYRLERVLEDMADILADNDSRLVLQLACRMWLAENDDDTQ